MKFLTTVSGSVIAIASLLAPAARAATTPTSTALSVTVAGATVTTVPAKTAVVLTATVTGSGAALTKGQVNFCDASAAHCNDIHILGTAQITSAGTATLKLVPGPGTHIYNAVFLGTTSYATSVSSTVSLVVVAAAGPVTSTVGIEASGGQGNYGLLGTVATSGLASPTGNVSFLDTSNSNYPLGSAVVGPTGSSGISFLDTSDYSLDCPAQASCFGSKSLVADVNNDGIPDILVTPEGEPPFILIGNGAGSFHRISTSVPYFGVLGDFNGDGKIDVAVQVVVGGLAAIQIWFGNGDGTFTVGPTKSTNAPLFANMYTADFNSDGNVDILALVAYYPPNDPYDPTYYFEVLLGNGDGTFSLSALTPYNFSSSLVVGDFNGDGYPDLAVVEQQQIDIYMGNGDGTFRETNSIVSATTPGTIATADLNNDGKLDIVGVNSTHVPATVLLGNGDGTFTAMPPDPNLGQYSASIAFGDFNGDGIPDLVFPNQAGGYTSVFLGRGDGTFVPDAFSPSATGFIYFSVAVADLNGDGQSDIVEAVTDNRVGVTPSDDHIAVLLSQAPNTAAGYAYNISPVGTGLHYVEAVYPGDVNNAGGTSATVGLLAQQVTTTLALTENPPKSTVGQSVTLSAAVTPNNAQDHDASGKVTFFSNGKSLGTANVSGGVASLPTTALTVGNDNLKAVYAGDTNFLGSTSSIVAYPVLTPSQSSLGASPNPVAFGQNVLLRATVASAGALTAVPSGTVLFFANGTQLGTGSPLVNGTTTLNTSSLPVGADTLTCTYSGDAVFGSSTCLPITENVTADGTSTLLTASPNPAVQGQTITFIASVQNTAGTATPTGSVALIEGATTLASGNDVAAPGGATATFALNTLAPGVHILTAVYTPAASNANVTGSTSPSISVTVMPSAFTVTISPATLQIQTEHHGSVSVEVSSVGGLSGPVTLSCGTLPQFATCEWQQNVVSLPANGKVSTQLTIDTDAVLGFKSDNRGYGAGSVVMGLLLPLCGLLRSRCKTLRGIMLALMMAAVMLGGSGCGDKYPGHTPPGTYTVVLTGSGVSPAPPQTADLTLVVTP